MSRTKTAVPALLLVALLVVPSLGSASESLNASPAIITHDDLSPLTFDTESPRKEAAALWVKAEGWSFQRGAAQGRTTLTLDWTTQGTAFTGTLRANGQTYSVVATRDAQAWQDGTPTTSPIQRYLGTATPTNDPDAEFAFLLDHVVEDEYASGYIEPHDAAADDERVHLQLYATGAQAVANLPYLLQTLRSTARDPSALADAVVRTASPTALGSSGDSGEPGGPEPAATRAEGRVITPGGIILPVDVPWESVPSQARSALGLAHVPYLVVHPEHELHELENETGQDLPDAPNLPSAPDPNDVPDPTQPQPMTGDVGGGGSVSTTSPGQQSGECSSGCSTTPQCSDGIDNDGDGHTDHPNDPDCTSSSDNSESADPPPPPNHPPSVPNTPAGANTAVVGVPSAFQASGTDPDGDALRYLFDWGDGSQSYAMFGGFNTHTWSASGEFKVRVQSDDGEGGYSAWSPALSVFVHNAPIPVITPPDPFDFVPAGAGVPALPIPPNAPATPWTSSERVVTNQPQAFHTRATDPAGTSIQYEWTWDDSILTLTEYLPSGETASVPHAWTSPGTYEVWVVARNQLGGMSPYARPLTVVVKSPGGSAPPEPTITGPTSFKSQASFSFRSLDPDNDHVKYFVEWGDGTTTQTGWTTPGSTTTLQHAWTTPGAFTIRARATDDRGQTGIPSELVVQVTNQLPRAPSAPVGWDVMTTGATNNYFTSTTDPDGDSLKYEYDWGDGSAYQLTTETFQSGAQGKLAHSWDTPGVYHMRARALDASGMRGAWSNQTRVEVGIGPLEFAVSSMGVSSRTPWAGELVKAWATVENRAANDASVDVTLYDDDTPVDTRPIPILGTGNSQIVEFTYQLPGVLGKGVRQFTIVANAASDANEVTWRNNQKHIDVRVRDPAVGDKAYGALYDGPGPANVAGFRLHTALVTKYRTPDANTYDEKPVEGSQAARLLLWSPNLTNTETAWYYTDKIEINLTHASNLSLENARPRTQDANVTIAEDLSVRIGYTSRASQSTNTGTASPLSGWLDTATFGLSGQFTEESASEADQEAANLSTLHINYTPRVGTSLTTNQTTHAWTIRTNQTSVPNSTTNAIGVTFDLQDAVKEWPDLAYEVVFEYTRAERAGNASAGSVYLWHEKLRAGTSPVRASIQSDAYPPMDAYEEGGDYNLGDRSMTSSPTWDVSADTRRTYYDGVADASAQDQEGNVSQNSTAYYWFRLDGPIYQSHDVEWRWYGPHNNYTEPLACACSLHFKGPVELGYPEGTFISWAEFRQGLQFTANLAPQYRGTWHVEVLVDDEPTTRASFHIMATTSDEPEGPEIVNDEDLAQASDAAAEADPSNENLPNLDPVNKLYLDTGRVDGKIESEQTRLDDTIASYVSKYLADQVNEAAGIVGRTVDPILPQFVQDTIDPITYDVVETLREFPSTKQLTRTVLRTVQDITQGVLASCSLDVTTITLTDVENLPDDATACLTHVLETVVEASQVATATLDGALDGPVSQLSLVNTTLSYANDLTSELLADPAAIIADATTPVSSLVDNVTGTLVDLLPVPPVPVNLHPTNLADAACIVEAVCLYDMLMQTGPDPEGAKETTVSAADSLYYNLIVLTDAQRSWIVRNVALVNVTLIDMDDNESTGLNGQELAISATMTPNAGTIQLPPLNAGSAVPTLRVQALTQTARATPMLACAYYQLPGVAFIATTCLDTRNETLTTLGAPTPSRGFPDNANVSLQAYSFDADDPNATASMRLENHMTSPSSIPILASGSVFQVDLTKRDKPRIVDGDHVDAALYHADARGSSEWHLRRATEPPLGASSEWSWTSTATSSVQGAYELKRGERTVSASSNMTKPAASLDVKVQRDASDNTLDVTTSLTATEQGLVTLAMRDETGNTPGEAFSLNATRLPSSLTLQADDAAGTVAYAAQGGAPQDLHVVATNARTACPSLAEPNQLTRRAATPEEGSCMALDIERALTSVSMSLATSGPRLNFQSEASTSTPLGLLVHDAATRSLDASFTHTPSSASLQSSLAQPDGSTALSWTASDSIGHVRVLATSGDTLLSWDATSTPTSAQASYQWSADTITIGTLPENVGVVEFLLTNQGNVPALEAGDYVTGTKTGSQLAAAARLTGVREARASLATPSFQVNLTGGAYEPFALRYARSTGPSFTFDTTGVPTGGFNLQAASVEGGTHRLDYAASERGASFGWLGRFAGAHGEGNVTDAPASFAFTTTPTTGSLDLDAGEERVGAFRVVHAASAGSAALLGGEDAIHLQPATAGGVDTYRASFRDVTSFTLSKSQGSLTLLADQSPEHPLRVHVGDASTFLKASVSTLPASVLLTYGNTGLHYAATAGSSPTWDVRVKENDMSFGYASTHTPSQVDASWTSAQQAASLSLTHNAASIPSLLLEASFDAPGGTTEFLRLDATDAPESVSLSFDGATDTISLSASPTPVSLIAYQHAANAQSLSVPIEPNHILMHRTQGETSASDVAYEALRLENATSATLRLAGQAALTNQLTLEALSPNAFYAEYANTAGDGIHARASNIPGRLDLTYALGSQNAPELGLTQENSGTIGELVLQATQGGRALDVQARDVPASWNASWSPASAFTLHASAPMKIAALSSRAEGEAARSIPNASAYLLVDEANAQAAHVAASFPQGVALLESDATSRSFRAAQEDHASITLRHLTSDTTMDLDLAQPAGSFELQAPPAVATSAVTLAWNADEPTGALAWGLDAADARWRMNATTLPKSASLAFDAPAGTLDVNVPDGAGALFEVRYVDQAEGSFRGDQTGLVLLARPTGPEGYPAEATSFTLDMPHLTSATATFTGTSGTGLNVGFTAALERAADAGATNVSLLLASGAETHQLRADGLTTSLATNWRLTPDDGFRGSITTQGLANVNASYRGAAGIANVSASQVQAKLALGLASATGDPTNRSVALAYENGALGADIDAYLDAAGALVNLHLDDAPTALDAEAPLECASTGATGRVWTSPGESAGRARLVIVPRDHPHVPKVTQSEKLVATCDANSATLQLEAGDFEEAVWTSRPADGVLEARLTTSASSTNPTRILTWHGGDVLLDAVAAERPATLAVAARSGPDETNASWTASGTLSSAKLVYHATHGYAEANLTNAPPAWSLGAATPAVTPLSYWANGAAGTFDAIVGTPTFSAHINATTLPARIDWSVPVTTCPAVTDALDARVSTLGSGAVGSLTYWIVPGQAGKFVDDEELEHASLLCDDEGPRTSASLTGVQEIRWERSTRSLAPASLALATPNLVTQMSLPLPSAAAVPNACSNGQERALLDPRLTSSVALAGSVALPMLTMLSGSPLLDEQEGVTQPDAVVPIVGCEPVVTSLTLEAPSVPMAAPASVPGDEVTRTINLTRDASLVNMDRGLSVRMSAYDEVFNATAWAPASSIELGALTAAGVLRMGASRDVATPKIHTLLQTAEGTTRAVHDQPSPSSDVELDASGNDLVLTHDAFAATDGGILLDTDQTGTRLHLNAGNGLPPQFTGTIKGGGSGGLDCGNAGAPIGASLTTLGTGTIGDLLWSLGTNVPKLATGHGAIYECTTGATPSFVSQLERLDVFEALGTDCTWHVVAPVDSLKETELRTVGKVPFDARLKIRMAPQTVGLLTATVAEDQVTARITNSTTPTGDAPVIDRLIVDYNGTGPLGATAGASASCLNFGGATVQQLNLTAMRLVGDLNATLGEDDDERSRVDLRGKNAEKLTLNVTTRKPDPAQAGEDNSTRLNLSARLNITGAIEVGYREEGSQPPGVQIVDANGHYAIVGTAEGIKGGAIRVSGFQNASLLLDAVYLQGTGWNYRADAGYRAETGGSPLGVVIFTSLVNHTDIALGPVPEVLDASVNLIQASNLSWRGDVAYAGSEGASLDLSFVENSTTRVYVNTYAPAQLAGSFSFHEDPGGDTVVTVDYDATPILPTPGVTSPLAFVFNDPKERAVSVSVGSMPTVLNAVATLTTCGFDGTLTTSHDVDYVAISNFPKVRPEPTTRSEDCPKTLQDQGKDPGVTSIVARLEELPAGTLHVNGKLGHKAGELAVPTNTGGTIGRVELTSVTEGGADPGSLVLIADDLRLRVAQWDIDGDTRYDGSPTNIFLDGSVGGLLVDVAGSKPLHLDTEGAARFDNFGFRLPHWGLDALELQYAGCMTLIDHDQMTAEMRGGWAFLNPLIASYLFIKNTNPFDPDGKWGWQC